MTRLLSSIAAALALASAAARADVAAGEAGNPDSIDHPTRPTGDRSPSNDEIAAAEIGNPDSVDYADRMKPSGAVGWQALESGSPDVAE